MILPLSLAERDLTNLAILKEFDDLLDEYERTRAVGEALDVLRHLEKLLDPSSEFARLHPDAVAQWNGRLLLLRFVALPVLPLGEVPRLLRESLIAALGKNLDVIAKLDHLLAFYRDAEIDGAIRRDLINAVVKNIERIGRQPIRISSTGESVAPSISNWIRDFVLSTSSKDRLGTVEEVAYLNQSQNVRQLVPNERELLHSVLRIYNWLRTPHEATVVTPTGHEAVRTPGVAAPPAAKVAPATPSFATPVAQLMATYEQYVASQRASKAIEQEIESSSGRDLPKVKLVLGAAINAKDLTRSLAGLRVLAKSGGLVQILVDEPTVQKWLAGYLEQKYGKSAEARVAIDDLMTRPTSPEAVSEFLQFVLGERLGMSDEDSALVGVELGLLLKAAGQPAFEHLAYGDEATATFSWVDHRVENGKFVREVP